MGAGVAQVVALLAATVLGLPLFFFALMSALDRFEQKLPAARPALALATAPAQSPEQHPDAGERALEPVLPGLDAFGATPAVVRLTPATASAASGAGVPRSAATI